MKSFIKKLVTGIAGLSLLVLVIYYSVPGFLVVLSLAAALGWHEYRGLISAREHSAPLVIPIAFVIALIYQPYHPVIEVRWLLYGMGVYLTLWSVIGVKNVQQALPSLAATLLGLAGLAAPLVSLAEIVERGPDALVFLLVVVWLGDGCAFLIGSRFGRRPLAPTISPAKTWEGAIANILGATAIAAVVHMFVLEKIPLMHALLLGLVLGILAIIGDLLESQWKRYAARKDSANLLPGHGGILDRVDSLILAAPGLLLYLKAYPIH